MHLRIQRIRCDKEPRAKSYDTPSTLRAEYEQINIIHREIIAKNRAANLHVIWKLNLVRLNFHDEISTG